MRCGLVPRQVVRRAHHQAGRRDRFRRRWRATRKRRQIGLGGNAGQAEVEHFDLPFARDHQIVRLDVAVDHLRFECVLQPECRLANALASGSDRKRALALDESIEADAFDVLHDQKVQAVRLVGVVGGDDVGVIELACRTDFAAEAFDGFLIGRVAASNYFDRNGAAHCPLLGLIHDAHAAGTSSLKTR